MAATETVTLTRPPTGATAGGVGAVGGAPSLAAVEIPKRLGSVALVREIGKGGMGVVWLGRHELLNRDVAVKFLLNFGAADDPGFVTFLDGARAAATLRHKGLNTVVHADVIEGVPFIVMDYVEGPTLADLLRASGCATGCRSGQPVPSSNSGLPLAVTRVVLEAACDAVAQLHDANIIHRDIKPSNLLLAQDGCVVLTDFGLAMTRPAPSMGTAVEGVAGTPSYMAPEMFDKVISPRSDVYALGIMAYELLVGELPFDGTLEDVRRAHRDFPLPARITQPALAELAERATSKNPVYRYKTARHMHRAVEEAFAQLDQMLVARARGETDLVNLINKVQHGDEPAAETTPTPVVNTYYDKLTTLVAKRKAGDPGSGDHTPAADDLVERVPLGVRCSRCGQELANEPVTGRCPGCLLLIRLTLDPSAPRIDPPSSAKLTPNPADAPKPAPAAQPAPLPPTTGLLGRAKNIWNDFFGS